MRKNLIKKIGVLILSCLVFVFTMQVNVSAAETVRWSGPFVNGMPWINVGVNSFVDLPIYVDLGTPELILSSIKVSATGGNLEIKDNEYTYGSGQTASVIPQGRIAGETGGYSTLKVTIVTYTKGGQRNTITREISIQLNMDEDDDEYDPSAHDEYTQDDYMNGLDEDGVFDPNNAGSGATSTYGDPDDLANILNPHGGVGKVIFDFALLVAMILTFIAVIMVGVNIIMARGNGEQRSSSMQGLMYIVIGIIILDLVLAIYGMFSGLVGDPEAEVDELDVEVGGGED